MEFASNFEGLAKWSFAGRDRVERQNLRSQIIDQAFWVCSRITSAGEPVGFVGLGERHQQIACELFHRDLCIGRKFHLVSVKLETMPLMAEIVSLTTLAVFVAPSEKRTHCRAALPGFIAATTCEGSGESARQADPLLAQIPA